MSNMRLTIFITMFIFGCFYDNHNPTTIDGIYEPSNDNITIPQNKRYI